VRTPAVSRPFPSATVKRGKKGRVPFPAAIPPIPSISDGQSGDRDGGGLGNRRADVDSLGRSRVRVRSRLHLLVVVVGGVRCSPEGVPLQCA
jgi:hypothetical protein